MQYMIPRQEMVSTRTGKQLTGSALETKEAGERAVPEAERGVEQTARRGVHQTLKTVGGVALKTVAPAKRR